MAMAIERDEEGKRCPVCGNWFYRKTEFCSDDCFAKYQSRKKVCSVCGREFYPRYARTAYCSDICRAKKTRERLQAQQERRAQTHKRFLLVLAKILQKKQPAPKEKSKRRRAVHEERICPVCGKHFVPVRSTKICCSPACNCKKNHRKNRKIYRRVCPVCGKEFETAYLKKMCCSDGCRTRQQKTHRSRVLLLMKPFKRECPVCGIHFYSTSSTYCSEKCEKAEW